MTGLLHLYAFLALVLVILVLAWIAMILHAEEDPPARGDERADEERAETPTFT
jgi:hypothetical protein